MFLKGGMICKMLEKVITGLSEFAARTHPGGGGGGGGGGVGCCELLGCFYQVHF